jgi:hypothetical protein
MSRTHRGGTSPHLIKQQGRSLMRDTIQTADRFALFRALREAGHKPRVNLTNEQLLEYALERAHDMKGRL